MCSIADAAVGVTLMNKMNYDAYNLIEEMAFNKYQRTKRGQLGDKSKLIHLLYFLLN